MLPPLRSRHSSSHPLQLTETTTGPHCARDIARVLCAHVFFFTLIVFSSRSRPPVALRSVLSCAGKGVSYTRRVRATARVFFAFRVFCRFRIVRDAKAACARARDLSLSLNLFFQSLSLPPPPRTEPTAADGVGRARARAAARRVASRCRRSRRTRRHVRAGENLGERASPAREITICTRLRIMAAGVCVRTVSRRERARARDQLVTRWNYAAEQIFSAPLCAPPRRFSA